MSVAIVVLPRPGPPTNTSRRFVRRFSSGMSTNDAYPVAPGSWMRQTFAAGGVAVAEIHVVVRVRCSARVAIQS